MKCKVIRGMTINHGRSREGAWIEIQQMLHQESEQYRRSREGAWIEILNTV